MQEIIKYFPGLDPEQKERFEAMGPLYREWNERINLISRKDVDNLYVNHILHSLAIAKVVCFRPGTAVMDVGTGGGFPGIPLAVMFPECRFKLIDSIGKKIMVVDDVARRLGLTNVEAVQCRAEEVKEKFDFVVSRAVTDMPTFLKWVWDRIIPRGQNALPNGVLYLKGGDLSAELKATHRSYIISDISDYFDEEYFETKKVVYFQR